MKTCLNPKTNLCPCCSERSYFNCCEPFILGIDKPSSPEQLMRSRYTAYTLSNIHYIKSTMLGEALKSFNYFDSYEWSKSVSWKGLSIIAHSEHGNDGTVTFIARYEQNGQLCSLNEKSQFRKEQDMWYYVDVISA
jgi:SEC-C motif domain protein